MYEWLPMSEAPKDDTYILIADSDGDVTIASWRGMMWGDGFFNEEGLRVNPVKWMPLPKA